MRTIKKLIFLLVISLLVSLIFPIVLAQDETGTEVGGILWDNTTWTLEHSPYNLTDDVLVDEGVTLTIKPGVTVYFNDYFMAVAGTLSAIGTETNKIVMTGSDFSYTGDLDGRIAFLSTSNNSIIEYAEISSTPGVIIGIYETSPTISNNLITGSNSGNLYYAISIVDGSPPITNNTISHNRGGISLYSTSKREQTIITGNIISSNDVGLYLAYDYSSPLISDNIIANNIFGIIADCMRSNGTITNNLIINNFGHLENGYPSPMIAEGGGIVFISALNYHMNITNNTICNNSFGIDFYGSPSSNILQNNIFDNINRSIRNTLGQEVNAENNWWGTTNTTLIEQSIYDFYDDYGLGKVNYNPFLTEPNPYAPSIPEDMIPEFPSFVILSILLVVSLLAIIVRKNYRVF